MRTTLASIGWVATWFWPLLYTPHVLGTCTMGSEDGWSGSLFVVLPVMLVMLGAASAGIGGPKPLRWLTIPHVFTVILALAWVSPYLWGTTFLGKHLCSVRDGGFEDYASSAFAPYWAPVQFAALGLLIYVVVRTWTSSRNIGTRVVA
jgi:hypothetical protein